MGVIVRSSPEVISLRAADGKWEAALRGSMLVGLGAGCKSWADKIDGPILPKIGSLLQILSFGVAAILFAALGLHQFTSDKGGLAMIAMFGFALWLGGYLLGGKETRRASAIDIIVLLYFATNVVAACASHYFQASLHGLEKLFIYICSYFYFTSVLNNAPKRRVLLTAVLVAAATAVSLYGLYEYKIGGQPPLATWEDPTIEVQGIRLYSTLDNPNLLAGYLIPIAPLALGLAFAAIAGKRYLLSIPAFGAAILIGVATILTGSRGGYIAIGAAVALAGVMVVARAWQLKPKLRVPLIILCIVVPLVLVLALHFVPSFEQRLTSIFAGREHSSNSFRMNVWHSSIQMLKDNWWFGVGPGNQAFVLAYGLYMRSGFDALGTYCVPLEVAVETGVLGLASFAVLILSLCARGHLSFWSRSLDTGKWLTALAVASLVGMMAHGLVDTVFYRPQVQFIFWLLVALIVSDKKD